MAARKLVIAIDFGTTNSGYAFSLGSNRKEITYGFNWDSRLDSRKEPTSVLLDPKKTFYAFGYEAEDKFSSLMTEGKSDGWVLFRQLKMVLYNNKNISKKTMTQDITGTVTMPAIDIVSMVIRHITDHAKSTIRARKECSNIKDSDVYFVITMPAIWDNLARIFMKKATVLAGIPETNIGLALESEAASIWCQSIHNEISKGKTGDISKAGSKYMVVDIGGGIADITAHEKLKNGKLKELHKACGGDWGSNKVNDAFMEMLRNVPGIKTIERFTKDFTACFQGFLRNFEMAKRLTDRKSPNKITIQLPGVLGDLQKKAKETQFVKSMVSWLQSLTSASDTTVSFKDDTIQLDAGITKGMFKYSIDGICEAIESILKDDSDLRTIIVVGGFSESEVVHEAIQSRFGVRGITIIYPPDPDLVVMSGAVLYGHSSGIIESRKARFTYGLKTTIPFDDKIHNIKDQYIKTKKLNGKLLCTNHFQVLINKGDDVCNDEQIAVFHESAYDEQMRVTFEMFICTQEGPTYVDEPHCFQKGCVTVNVHEGDRQLETTLCIEDNEMMLMVKRIKSAKIDKMRFDFM
ncbi:hypothetical protein ACF0H5_023841 [Mactra antiquata]